MLRRKKTAGEIDVDDGLPFGKRKRGKRADRPCCTGIVESDIEAAELCLRRSDESLVVRLLADITG
jgi:hypothetical protein